MKLMKRNLVLLLAVVTAAVGAHVVTVAIGQPAGGPPPDEQGGLLVRWLGLSGEAAEIVAAESQSFQRDMRQLDRQVRVEQLELANLMEFEDATDEQIRAQFDALAQAHLATHNRIADNVLAIRPHLDADQRLRFNDFFARHLRGETAGGAQGGPGGPGQPGAQQQRPGGPDQGPPPGGRLPPPSGPGGFRDGPPPPPEGETTESND